MSNYKNDFSAAYWAQNLHEVDKEVARLAAICNVKILDPGVIERVLKNDASVCGTANAAAFKKLRDALMIHYSVREKAVDAIGHGATDEVVKGIIERLKKTVGKGLGGS